MSVHQGGALAVSMIRIRCTQTQNMQREASMQVHGQLTNARVITETAVCVMR